MKNFYEGKAILVTGGVGSIGSEIVRELLLFNPKAVRVLDGNETGLFNQEPELQSEKIKLFVGDVKDQDLFRITVPPTFSENLLGAFPL